MNITVATAAEAGILTALDHCVPFSAHWSLQNWQEELAQPAARIWCAQDGGQLVGFIALRGAAGQWELLNIAVNPNRQRQGIATALMRQALAALGMVQITLEVSTANQAAQALYQKMGFVKLGVRKEFYKDGSDALIMGNVL